MKKKIFYPINNLCRMFVKDQGAHFTYNLGVSIMRVSLLFFVITVLLTIAYFTIDGVRLEYLGDVQASITELAQKRYIADQKTGRMIELEKYIDKYGYQPNYELEKHHMVSVYSVTFEVTPPDVMPYKVRQLTTWTLYNDTYLYRLNLPDTYSMYSVGGRDEFYICMTSKNKKAATREYCGAYGQRASPVPPWAIFIPLIISVILFLMGRKQINLAMKYPRSDVPEEIAFAPVPIRDEGSAEPDISTESCTDSFSANAHEALPDKGAIPNE